MALRCLIVDDNQWFLEAARVLLERQGVMVAGVASTGAEALRLAMTLRPAVVLVDIFLGAESGLDVARRLTGELGGDATVILISTRTEEDVRDLFAACTTVAFLPKSELSAEALRRIVDGPSGTRGK